MKLVAKVPVDLSDTDVRPHVMRLRKAKADAVLLWVSPVHAVRILGTAHVMRFKPQWMSTSTCSDFPLMYKISKGLRKGVITTNFAELPDSTSPLMLKYKAAFKKYAAKGERCGRNLNTENLVKTMESIKNFRGIMGKISYKPFNPKDPSCR